MLRGLGKEEIVVEASPVAMGDWVAEADVAFRSWVGWDRKGVWSSTEGGNGCGVKEPYEAVDPAGEL